jgi:SAM-dependent methyltransferase
MMGMPDPRWPGPASSAERAAIFADVYENNQWGRSPTGARYYSDSPPEASGAYSAFVSAFIAEQGVTSVVDLCCGDHEAASNIDLGIATYIGVDIYPDLIAFDQERHGDERRRFVCADVVEDDLPPGQLALVALALYIMSFDDIGKVLAKLGAYELVLITDGQPPVAPEDRRNIDKPTDKYTRQDYFGNGLWLELPPFSLPVEVVHEYVLPSGEHIRTVLWRPLVRPGEAAP